MGVLLYSLGYGYYIVFSPIVNLLYNIIRANKVIIRSLKAGWSIPKCLNKVYCTWPIIFLEPNSISWGCKEINIGPNYYL